MQVNTGAPTVGTGRRRVDSSPIFCFFFFGFRSSLSESFSIFFEKNVSGIFEVFFVHDCRFF